MLSNASHVLEKVADVSKWETNWVPFSCSSAIEEAVEMGPSALLQRNDNSSMLGIFILDDEMETEFPLCPTKQLLRCSLCCVGGAALSSGLKGWRQIESKVNVQCFWHLDAEETICGSR